MDVERDKVSNQSSDFSETISGRFFFCVKFKTDLEAGNCRLEMDVKNLNI